MQAAQARGGEPGPDLARVGQLAVGVVVADQERAQSLPGALRVGVAADHELLAGDALELEPVAGPALGVRGVRALGDQSLPAVDARLPVEGLAVPDAVLGVAQRPGEVQQGAAASPCARAAAAPGCPGRPRTARRRCSRVTGKSSIRPGAGCATPSRCCSIEKLVCPSRNATTSPSTTKPSAFWARSASATSGNVAVTSRSLRVSSRTPDPSRNASRRSPSSFRSNSHSGSENLSFVSVASCGWAHDGICPDPAAPGAPLPGHLPSLPSSPCDLDKYLTQTVSTTGRAAPGGARRYRACRVRE